MDGVGGKAGWAWIFILVSHISSTAEIVSHICSGRAVQCNCWYCRLFPRDTFSTGIKVSDRHPEGVITPFSLSFMFDPSEHVIISIVNRRLERDRPSITPTDRFSLKEIVGSVNSPHVILMFPVFFMLGTGIYGLANFLPSVVRQLGYSATQSQLLSVGPFAASFCGQHYLPRIMPSTYIDYCFDHSNLGLCVLFRSV